MNTYRIDYTAKTKHGKIPGLQAWHMAENAVDARRALLKDPDLKDDISALTGVPVSEITGVRIDRVTAQDR